MVVWDLITLMLRGMSVIMLPYKGGSMKCEIQWVDAAGNLTPDSNDAICFAVYIYTYSGGRTMIKKYPCCENHARELDDLVNRGLQVFNAPLSGTYQWKREPLPDDIKQ